MQGFDTQAIREQFPALSLRVSGKPLAYLDNAATAQKPRAVLDALANYYARGNSNVHRGVHHLAQVATEGYESARDKVKDWIRATSREEVIWTRGTTESINLVSKAWLRPRVNPGDQVLLTAMEHHSNIVPWQLVRDQTGIEIKVVEFDERGVLDMAAFEAALTDRTKLVSVVHISNSIGTVNPVGRIVELAKARGIPVLLDGAQAVPHMRVDVSKLGCDFYAFSGHKMFGPTGIGVLWGKKERLEEMEPWQGGGDMIKRVTFTKTLFNDLPYRFEAGTPNIAGATGMGATVSWLARIDWDGAAAHENALREHAETELAKVPGLRLIGTAPEKASVVSFVLEQVHAHDVGQFLDGDGVAVRVGHHCTQPLMDRFGVPATARASFAFYNTHEEVEQLVAAVRRVAELFS
ncbi:MAG: aminotransferase class V-fold PLP-dependent enzyme [Planctomycetota bacterium]